jgi:hypothetical protein
MTAMVDDRFAKLRALGFLGSTNDMVLAWLLANGATTEHIDDAWRQFLAAKGFTGARNDAWFAYLGSLGYAGTIDDREALFWSGTNVLGPELILNGGFDSGSNWTPGAGWSIAAGLATAAAVAVGIGVSQVITSLLVGKTYRVTFTVTGYVSGNVRAVIVGAPVTPGTTRAANGTYTQDLTVLATSTSFAMRPVSVAFTGSIDNISIRQVA